MILSLVSLPLLILLTPLVFRCVVGLFGLALFTHHGWRAGSLLSKPIRVLPCDLIDLHLRKADIATMP